MRGFSKLAATAAILLALLAGLIASQWPDAPRISPDEADRYVGKFCIVEGRIVQVSWRRTATFLNYRPYRRGARDFYLVIVGRDRERFDRAEVESWEGKVIQVYGRIELYRGRPQIRLRDPNQVRVLDEPPKRPQRELDEPRGRGPLAPHVTVQFWGATREVGGSAILLSNGRTNVLLDCGALYGEQRETRKPDEFPFEPDAIDAVILSHVHLDHIGRLPYLYLAGYRGRMYATRVTRDLASIMLGQVLRFDEALQGKISVRELIQRFVAEDYHDRFLVADDVKVSFLDAGHIPGSAVTVVQMRTAAGTVEIAYTGDYGNGLSPFLRDPEQVERADALIVEATYGDAIRRFERDRFGPFVRALAAALAEDKRVIIPAFVLDRTQKLLWVIGRARRDGKLKEVPVYVTSGTARRITRLYDTFWRQKNQFAGYFSRSWLRQKSPFFGLRYRPGPGPGNPPPPRPSIVIASSADGLHAASRDYIEQLAIDPNTAFFVVGYAPPKTPVGQLAAIATGKRPPRLEIGGRTLPVRAKVKKFSMFSGHADGQQMTQFVTACRNWRQVFVVHGEEDSCLSLVRRLRGQFPAKAEGIVAPRFGESFRVRPREARAPVTPSRGSR